MNETVPASPNCAVRQGNALAAFRRAGLPLLVRGDYMSVLPNPFFALRTTWQTAKTARRLKRSHTAVPAQQRTFDQLITKLSESVCGRELGITAVMSYAEFRARIPLRDHQQLQPYFRRIARGEADVLWPGSTPWSTATAGTTGEPKWLPVNRALTEHFEQASHAALIFYCARKDNTDVFRGRLLSLSEQLPPARAGETGLSATAPPMVVAEENPATAFSWGVGQLCEPGGPIAQIPDWSAKIKAILDRTLGMDISLLAGLPNWLLLFVDEVRERRNAAAAPVESLREVWPQLECVIHHGIPVAPFQDELKRAMGSTVTLHEVYFAAEAFIAAQDADAGSGLRLIDDAGVFFEFVPLSEYNEALPLTLGTKALSLAEVQSNTDYVIVVTTPAGLCRYVLGDVVRFISTEPPRLIPVGRTKERLTAFAENVLEKELTDSLVAVCHRHGWSITNFHVAPLFGSSLIGHNHGRHEWWVELRPGTAETPTGPILAAHIDVELQARNASYASRRQAGPLESPLVRLVIPGFFAHWMQHHQRWGGQKKMPRCRNDRVIADQFSAIACFNAD